MRHLGSSREAGTAGWVRQEQCAFPALDQYASRSYDDMCGWGWMREIAHGIRYSSELGMAWYDSAVMHVTNLIISSAIEAEVEHYKYSPENESIRGVAWQQVRLHEIRCPGVYSIRLQAMLNSIYYELPLQRYRYIQYHSKPVPRMFCPSRIVNTGRRETTYSMCPMYGTRTLVSRTFLRR